MQTLLAILLTLTLGCVVIAQEDDKESKLYLTAAGKLPRELKLTLTGEKVAQTQAWLIEPAGQWTVTTAAGAKAAETSQSGYLSAAEIAALAKDLEDFRLRELPRDVAPRSTAPACLYTLSFGYFSTTYELASDQTLPAFDPARNDPLALPAHRFAAIVRAIQSRLK